VRRLRFRCVLVTRMERDVDCDLLKAMVVVLKSREDIHYCVGRVP